MLNRAACPVEPDSRAFTETALAALRADGWSPGGWARFAATVARRSGDQVAAHPHAAVEITVLHGLFLAAARGRGRCWIATSWLMAVTHLGLLGPLRSIGWPNAISLTRANLAVTGAPLGRWLGVVAAVSDKLDGTLARQQGPTMFGFYADSLADAVFWTWLASRGDPSWLVLAASVAAWAAPVAAVAAASIAKGEMVECPRPALVRPAAAMQVALAARTLNRSRPNVRTPERGNSSRATPGCRPEPKASQPPT